MSTRAGEHDALRSAVVAFLERVTQMPGLEDAPVARLVTELRRATPTATPPEPTNCRGRDCGHPDCTTCTAISEWVVRQDAEGADTQPPAAMTAALLRAAAAGRREYAGPEQPGGTGNAAVNEMRDALLTQAATLESAARIAEGDFRPLYGLLPSWRWTPEMERRLVADGEGSTIAMADVAALVDSPGADTPPPADERPTREQLEADLQPAGWLPPSPRADRLAAEVRALRADLDRVHSCLRHESDAHVAERDRLRAALAARTPQPAAERALLPDATEPRWPGADPCPRCGR